ncbi:hypothetical protein [Saccharomonospora sp.]|uniref:hypothetical protein n=1 Tax=Saccharomonospora sp. TaxID=33913 RepID=UPI00262AFBAE|nr:hypothetical protein [Saccharomonospora sp.]
MRSVRRGMVAAALAFPLAFGFAGVATAGEKEVDANWASYEASYAFAGPFGAAAGDVSSEAGSVEYENEGDKDKKDSDKGHKNGDSRGDKSHNGKDNGYEKELGWAGFETEGAAAGVFGAGVWEVESEAGYAEKG